MKTMKNSTIALATILLISSVESYGAPIINTLVNNGQSLTIQGSGFNTHSKFGGDQPFLNKAWNNFENGTLNGGNIEMGGYPQNWRINTINNKPNSKKYAEKFFNDGRLGALEIDQNNTPNEWFISFWFKVLDNNQSGKFLRIYGSNGNIYFSTGGPDYQIRAYGEGADGPTQWGSPNTFTPNKWHKFEVYMRENPKALIVWLDGKQQWSRPDMVATNFGGNGHTMDIGNMIDSAEEGYGDKGSYSYDDVYVDHTQSRVEIGNASTWSASTIRAIQIPTSWSDSSIKVNLNKGSITSDTAYLFVIDSAGNASTGYPINLKSTSTSTLSAPANLKLNP
ncbi:MAG: hypothetical protein IPL51_06760 [Candidatus Competibacteraceae bacterium]|nr:hypothetical protein [Candidatus Competibacteraceae bacterium]